MGAKERHLNQIKVYAKTIGFIDKSDMIAVFQRFNRQRIDKNGFIDKKIL